MFPFQVLQLARFCKEAGITHFIGSPGSRSAPILLALVRHGGFQIEMVMDERSAGYRALGMCLALQKPVGLFCTSGTAVLNYGPAIAEAFYQNLPLVVLTADRPPESIDQFEGQAIRQTGIFQLHTRFSATIPSTDQSEAARIHTRRILNEAYFHATQVPAGPVHLNFPFRDPFYPDEKTVLQFETEAPVYAPVVQSVVKLEREELSPLIECWNQSGKRLVVAGQMTPKAELNNACRALTEYANCVMPGDCLHNLRQADGLVLLADCFPGKELKRPDFEPDILITLGDGILSKSIRQFLARIRPRHHWHVCSAGFPPDPYGTVTQLIKADPTWFLTKLAEASYFTGEEKSAEAKAYKARWMGQNQKAIAHVRRFGNEAFWSDLKAVQQLMSHVKPETVLFLGNSMAVRYANWFAFDLPDSVPVYSNRGTSGIDGCISTAVGLAKAMPEKMVLALVGDMSFVYDRNGLWSGSLPQNLKICVLNNGGGNIFRIIPGSGTLPELDAYFELNQNVSAKNSATEAGMAYYSANDLASLEGALPGFLQNQEPAILECFTGKLDNVRELKNFKNKLESENG